MSGREWTFELKLRVSKMSRLSHSLSYLTRHSFFDQHISHLSFDIRHFISKLFFDLLVLLLQLLLLVLASVQRWLTPVLISLSFTLGRIFTFLRLFDLGILTLLGFVIIMILWALQLSQSWDTFVSKLSGNTSGLKTLSKELILCPMFYYHTSYFRSPKTFIS